MAHKTYLTNRTNSRSKKPKKTWKRWSELNGSFRETKYFFTENLIHIGDYMVTKPCTYDDYERFRHAAKAWAYRKGKRIKTELLKCDVQDMVKIKITLISHHRQREYEF